MATVGSAASLLREARTRAGLAQAELGRRANVTQSVISAYESGRREPSLPVLLRLVSAAGFVLDADLRPAPVEMAGPIGQKVSRSRDDLRRLLSDHGVEHAWVFGSVARGEDHADSDLDLLIDLPAAMGLFALGRLRAALEEVVNVHVDLVPSDGLKTAVRQAVESERVLL